MFDAVEVRSWVSRLGMVYPALGDPALAAPAPADPALAGRAPAHGALSDAERVDLLGVLEDLKAAAAAAQAWLTAELDASVRAREAAAGLPAAERGRGVAGQVGLARRDSPARAARHVGVAKALTAEMPYTLAALATGRLTEWRATLLVRETAWLSREHRAVVDRALAADPAVLVGAGDRAVADRARGLAYRLDPAGAVTRLGRAEAERRVTLRPAPDAMTVLCALLPVAQGVAAYAALRAAAETARAGGDPRSRAQVMADTLTTRVTGQASATAVPVTVDLVITDRALLAGDHEPALIPGYGPLPAARARTLLRPPPEHTGAGLPDAATVWLRRLYTHPSSAELVAAESRARAFPPGLRRLLVARDQTCRTPWCDAPIRHIDHALPYAAGGPTSAASGQGLCEACNYTKQAPGWRAAPAPASSPGHHTITTTTPTGHSYHSRPPPLPGAA